MVLTHLPPRLDKTAGLAILASDLYQPVQDIPQTPQPLPARGYMVLPLRRCLLGWQPQTPSEGCHRRTYSLQEEDSYAP
jgi:hypothetical protein